MLCVCMYGNITPLTLLCTQVRELSDGSLFVEDATEVYVTGAAAIQEVFATAIANRAVAATMYDHAAALHCVPSLTVRCLGVACCSMNERSSRSHCIFTVTIWQRNLATLITQEAKLHLVDLAGSEKVRGCAVAAGLQVPGRHSLTLNESDTR